MVNGAIRLSRGPRQNGVRPAADPLFSRQLDGDLEHRVWDRPYTGFTCPDCAGPLYLASEDSASALDCVVGRTWSPQSLLEEQSVAVEKAMWLAIRALDERARLTSRLAIQAEERGRRIPAERFREAAGEAYEAADQMRKVANGLSAAGSEIDDPSGRGGRTPIG